MVRSEDGIVTVKYPGTWWFVRRAQRSRIILNPSVTWDIRMRNAKFLAADFSQLDPRSFRREGSGLREPGQ
jgi:hypothetical protein